MKNDNFLDSRTLMAILLIGVVWFGWQSYLAKNYPQPAAVVQADAVEGNDPSAKVPHDMHGKPGATALAHVSSAQVSGALGLEQVVAVRAEGLSFSLSSYGMGLKEVVVDRFTDRQGAPVVLGDTRDIGLFSLVSRSTGQPIELKLEKLGENQWRGLGVDQGFTVERRLTWDSDKYAFDNEVIVSGGVGVYPGFSVKLIENKHHYSSSFLIPTFDHQELLVHFQQTNERINVSTTQENLSRNFDTTRLLAVGSQYFAMAVLDRSELAPSANAQVNLAEKQIVAMLQYIPLQRAESQRFIFSSLAGPKSYPLLKSVDPELTEVINFGFFATIAKWMLETMRWFHGFLANWGLAIIALTLLVRILVLPFNIASYRSMKKMQAIQPLMTALREKHKDDPQTMNREVMELMKREKVNPIGGCLPMLLQMPVFFALYQVIGQSIELYQAPFIGWIHDLSLKDPFYVLPILMGVALFFQQKITPTPVDPVQAKVLQFLPIVFSLMMIALPSGLTLYIFVSTLFGLVQQYFFMRAKTT